jgi:benzoate/toluate 1,2-dioxygenase reductase subunit
MNTTPVTLLFLDGATRRIDADLGESIVNAAGAVGLTLLTDCSNGQCGTCTANLVSGTIELDQYDKAVLPDDDRKCGAILTCVSRITGPCVVELPYDYAEAAADQPAPIAGRITAITQVASETVRLDVTIDDPIDFQPGQYVRIRPAGSEDWRSYSMANSSGSADLVFYVRIVPGGVFSTWLTEQAAIGSAVELSHPHGSFFLRDEPRPRLFVAGGTGLAPFLSMLAELAQTEGRSAQPTTLLLGVRSAAHLFALDEIDRLRSVIPGLAVHFAAECEPDSKCTQGYATDLIKTLDLNPSTRVYLCGPPPMVEAGRAALAACGMPRGDVLCERFA